MTGPINPSDQPLCETCLKAPGDMEPCCANVRCLHCGANLCVRHIIPHLDRAHSVSGVSVHRRRPKKGGPA